MNADVDKFVARAKTWKSETKALRDVLLAAKLDETLKWGKPCYGVDGANVAIIQPFSKCLGLMFFKGALLKDAKGVLVDNGPNSRSAKRLELHSVAEITKLKATIKAYVKEAIALEASGQKVAKRTSPEPIPDELEEIFRTKPKLQRAFEALTPGRQRGYVLFFTGAKQSATRIARITKSIPRILEGKGIHDP